jgi:hypothetical protein
MRKMRNPLAHDGLVFGGAANDFVEAIMVADESGVTPAGDDFGLVHSDGMLQ